MTARIDKPAFFSTRATWWACLFLSGVGIVSVAERLPDLFEDANAQSCNTSLPTLHVPSRDSSAPDSCAPVTTMQEPTFAATGSMMSAPDPMLLAWRGSLIHSAALQTYPYTWEVLPVSF